MITARANFVSVQLLRFASLEPHGEPDGCAARRIGSSTLPSRRAHWHHGGAPNSSECMSTQRLFTRFISAVLRDRLGNFQQCCGVLMLSSEIDFLMYSTFAVQSGESARKQRLAPVFPYVL